MKGFLLKEIREISARHSAQWRQKSFLLSLATGFLFLFASLVVNYYAGMYATQNASNPVTDIILSNIPIYDVDWVFVYGAIIFWIFIILLCVREPQKIPFVTKSVALFVIIRSLFITLTHLGPFPTHAIIDSNLFAKITFDGDLFFSGHVGLAFLMTLIFWKNVYLRIVCFGAAILFSFIVLMAHLHYSIDVLSAFFITYSIYHIARVFFKKDLEMFSRD